MDPKQPNKPDRAAPAPGGNEGEGNRTADKTYRQGVEKFERENDPERLARQAEEELDESSPETRRADEAGKGRLAGTKLPDGER